MRPGFTINTGALDALGAHAGFKHNTHTHTHTTTPTPHARAHARTHTRTHAHENTHTRKPSTLTLSVCWVRLHFVCVRLASRFLFLTFALHVVLPLSLSLPPALSLQLCHWSAGLPEIQSGQKNSYTARVVAIACVCYRTQYRTHAPHAGPHIRARTSTARTHSSSF